MMRRSTLLVALAAAVPALLAGCAAAPAPVDAQAQSAQAVGEGLLAEHDLAGMTAEQIVDELERVPVAERSTELMASVRPDRLVLSDAGQEVALPMPEGRSYVSIAPFVEQTHECWFHSLTTCRGELAGVPMHVTITDGATGEVLVDEAAETFDNGFVGYWLPRDVQGTITVEHDGRSGSAEFSTGADAATCITTLALA